MNVENVADLGKLRGWVSRFRHTDERRASRIVTLLRDGSIISRLTCASESLAWDCERICAGIRYRAASVAEWLASEPPPLFAA
jgi:hypothetical protein